MEVKFKASMSRQTTFEFFKLLASLGKRWGFQHDKASFRLDSSFVRLLVVFAYRMYGNINY